MRGLFLIAALGLAQPAFGQAAPAMDPAKAVAVALAANGEEVQGVFEMTVASSAGSGFNYYLNSEKDYRSDANLAIVIVPEVRNEIVAKSKAEPNAVFQGKRIRVTGVVRRVAVGSHFQTRITPQHASQIEIIG